MAINGPDPVARKLGAAGIMLVGIGQSNMQSAYPTLTYTPSGLAGSGGAQTITIAAGYSLKMGETVYARLAGAAPAGYNDTGYVPYTVGGTAPGGVTLTRAGTATGALTTAGTLVVNMRQTYPQAWVSQTDPATTSPLPPKDFPGIARIDGVNENGSPLIALRDRLATVSGRRVQAADCSIGSASLINHWAGFVAGWSASARFRCRRAPIAGDPQDRGCSGSLISVYTSSFVWLMMECTAGGDQVYCQNASSQYPLNGSFPGGTMVTVAGGATGATQPSWNGVTAVGQTVVDGALTWTCVAYNYSNSPDGGGPQSFPSADYRNKVVPRGKYGFDPFGLIQRAMDEAGRGRRNGLVPVIVMIGHESDLNCGVAGNTWFTDALQAVSDAVTSRRICFAPSLSYFNTVSGTASNFTYVSAQLKAFLANNTSNPAVLQHALNLYDYFGQTPGAGGLTHQRDNLHANEDIHQSALTATLAGAAMADAIWADLAGVMG